MKCKVIHQVFDTNLKPPKLQTYAENQGLINAVCALIPNASFDVRKEAATALFNTIAHGASDRTSRVLNANGVLETFVRMLIPVRTFDVLFFT